MAESQKSTDAKPAEAKPVLVAVDEKSGASEAPIPSAPPAAAAREEKRSNTLTYVLLLLLAGAVIAAAVQTQRHTIATERVAALGDQVLGLEVQLSAANLQIQTYEMQRGQVSQAVDDIAERVTLLQEMVSSGSSEPEAPPLGTP